MPSLSEWFQSLATPRSVTIDSSADLVRAVRRIPKSRSFKGRRKRISSVQLYIDPMEIYVSPIQILEALSRINSPRVRNLADLASIWAICRYLWAFKPDLTEPRLLLSHYARDLDFHQKGVLADDLGVGISAFIVRNFFGGSKPVPISSIIKKRLVGGLYKYYSVEPDYLFKDGSGGFIVVECKGTTSGLAFSRRQLSRGAEQVASIVIRKSSPLRLVIGSCLNHNETHINIIDPPQDKSTSIDNYKIYIEDKHQLQKDMDVVHAANLMLYCGEDDVANEILQEIGLTSEGITEERKQERANRSFDDLDQYFNGSISPAFSLGKGVQAKIFQGVRLDVIKNIEHGNFSSDEGLKEKYFQVMNSPRCIEREKGNHNSDIVILGSEDKRSIYAFSIDGTIFGIELN